MPPKTGMSAKRIVKEIAEVNKELPEGIRAGLKDQDNLYEWFAQIDGPLDSVYEGGVFDIDISIPQDYPFRPPRAQFKTRVYHMNINQQGGICLDILKNAWSPALSVLKVILSILSLLTDPNPNDPLVGDIARQYMTNRKAHDERARSETKQFARPEFANPPIKKVEPLAPKSAPMIASTSTASDAGSNNGKSQPKLDNSKPIVIEDDEDEDAPKPVAGGSRKRTASSEGQRNSKQPKTEAKTVIELD